MKRKRLYFLLSLVMCFSLVQTSYAEEKSATPENIRIATEDGTMIHLHYANAEEQDDGSFVFTRTDYMEPNSDGSIDEYHQSVTVVPLTEEYHQELVDMIARDAANDTAADSDAESATRGTVTLSDSTVDTTYTFSFNMTVVINTKSVNYLTYAKITSVSGGYYSYGGNYVGDGVYIRSQKVQIKVLGGLAGGGTTNSQTTTKYPAAGTNAWNYTTPSNWEHVFYHAGGHHDISAFYSIKAGRGATGTDGWTSSLLISYD